jgi:hypothetical protein
LLLESQANMLRRVTPKGSPLPPAACRKTGEDGRVPQAAGPAAPRSSDSRSRASRCRSRSRGCYSRHTTIVKIKKEWLRSGFSMGSVTSRILTRGLAPPRFVAGNRSSLVNDSRNVAVNSMSALCQVSWRSPRELILRQARPRARRRIRVLCRRADGLFLDLLLFDEFE